MKTWIKKEQDIYQAAEAIIQTIPELQRKGN